MNQKMLFIMTPVLNQIGKNPHLPQQAHGSKRRDFSIIFIDHGSIDGTRESTEDEFPDVVRLSGTIDMRLAGATNLGIQKLSNRAQTSLCLKATNFMYDSHSNNAIGPAESVALFLVAPN